MTNEREPIVVFGATGSQGGAVCRDLIGSGRQVRAVTRRPTGKRACKLAELGAEVVRADLDDPVSIERVMAGARGVFAVTDFMSHGVAKEVQHGQRMALAARAAGVGHFVLSSGASADCPGAAAHMNSKWEIEKFCRDLDLPMTVLRLALFMEDLVDPKYSPRLGWGAMNAVVGMDRVLPWIAVDDIGAAAAKVFAQPDSFVGKTLTLAGDRLSLRQCFYLFWEVWGRMPTPIALPTWLVRKLEPDLVAMWEWLRSNDMEGCPRALRSLHPGALDMRAWLPRWTRTAMPQTHSSVARTDAGVLSCLRRAS